MSALTLLLAACSGSRPDELSTGLNPATGDDAGHDAASGSGEGDDGGDDAGDSPDLDSGAGSDTEPDSGTTVDAGPQIGDATDIVLCGNGVLDPTEQCDDGAMNSDTEPNACRLRCVNAGCGDGVLDVNEACDNGALNSSDKPDACRTTCSLARCGDTTIDSGEQCDTGAELSDTAPGACRTSCMLARCGDSVRDTSEACDDGNSVDTDACRNDCRTAACGDNVRGPDEECDDGNTRDGDGCQSTCRLPVCGDDVVDPGETCDDGNSNSNDGCRNDCTHGCVAASECDDGQYCNGAERCGSDGRCAGASAPSVDDGVSCTHDACDEAAHGASHVPDDMLCSAAGPQCQGAVLTTATPRCVATRGCATSTSSRACPDATSTCNDVGNGAFALNVYTPTCNGAGNDCAPPAVATQTCAVPAPTCDTRARVGGVYAATCDANAERCGSTQTQRNDCTLLDRTTCGRGNTTALHTVGQCNGAGQCAGSTTTEACPTAADTCDNGATTSYVPTCQAGTGCGPVAAQPSTTCATSTATCSAAGRLPVYTTYTPTCADTATCLKGGTAVNTTCVKTPTCAVPGLAGEEIRYTPGCDVKAGGCTFAETKGSCRQADVSSCNGNTIQTQRGMCKEGRGCTFDVEATKDCAALTCGRDANGGLTQICGGCVLDPKTNQPSCGACRACATGATCVNPGNLGAMCQSRVVSP